METIILGGEICAWDKLNNTATIITNKKRRIKFPITPDVRSTVEWSFGNYYEGDKPFRPRNLVALKGSIKDGMDELADVESLERIDINDPTHRLNELADLEFGWFTG